MSLRAGYASVKHLLLENHFGVGNHLCIGGKISQSDSSRKQGVSEGVATNSPNPVFELRKDVLTRTRLGSSWPLQMLYMLHTNSASCFPRGILSCLTTDVRRTCVIRYRGTLEQHVRRATVQYPSLNQGTRRYSAQGSLRALIVRGLQGYVVVSMAGNDYKNWTSEINAY